MRQRIRWYAGSLRSIALWNGYEVVAVTSRTQDREGMTSYEVCLVGMWQK